MMLFHIVLNKFIGPVKLNVAGYTDIVLSPQMFVKLNQLLEFQWWNTNMTKMVKLGILDML